MSWQVGDLACCVDNEPRRRERLASRLEIGRIYHVAKCGIPKNADVFCLSLREIDGTDSVRCPAFVATRFRKVVKDTDASTTECEQLLRLLRRERVSA